MDIASTKRIRILLTGLVLALIAVLAADNLAAQRKSKKKKNAKPPPAARWISVAVQDGLAYYGRGEDLVLFDISVAGEFPEHAQIPLDSPAKALTVDGTTGLIALGNDGLSVFDLTEPENAFELAHWDSPGSATDLVWDPPFVYVALETEGLHILDLSELNALRSSARISTRSGISAIDKGGRWLAAAEGMAGVRLFELRSPGSLRERHALRDMEGAREVEVSEDSLWVARGKRGWALYSLDGDSRPELHIDGGDDGAVYGFIRMPQNRMVLLRGSAGIEVVRTTIKGGLIRESKLTLPRSFPVFSGVAQDDWVYLTGQQAGFAVLDLTDPDEPKTVFPRPRKLKIRFP